MSKQMVEFPNLPAGDGLDHANQPKLDPWVMLELLLFDRSVNQRMMVQDHVLLVSCVVYIPALVITGHLVPLCDISRIQSVSSCRWEPVHLVVCTLTHVTSCLPTQVLKQLVNVNLRVFMNCQSKLSDLPLKRLEERNLSLTTHRVTFNLQDIIHSEALNK